MTTLFRFNRFLIKYLKKLLLVPYYVGISIENLVKLVKRINDCMSHSHHLEKMYMALAIGRICGLNGRYAFYNGRVAITKSRLYLLLLRYAAKAFDMREAHDRCSALANNVVGSCLATLPRVPVLRRLVLRCRGKM